MTPYVWGPNPDGESFFHWSWSKCSAYSYVMRLITIATSVVTVAGVCNLVSGGVYFLHAPAVPVAVANIGRRKGLH